MNPVTQFLFSCIIYLFIKAGLVRFYVIPGGTSPSRQTDGAVGYDTHIRAIVSNSEMDQTNPRLRKTLFDFNKIPDDPEMAQNVYTENGELVYEIPPGESVLVGIGFVTEMKFPIFF